jgi:starch phosphorylase
LYNVDPGEMWETHNALKTRLLEFVRRRVGRQARRRQEPDEIVEAARTVLQPEALTIGFARRFATYKRADLIFRRLDELAELVNDPQRPVQLIFSGKAHPADEPGKQLIKKIANLRHDPRFTGRIVFVEDYDINVARHLVQGVEVWLNTPRRPKEASGTSGMKAVLNGALNCSILDGWWAEAYNGRNGFAIGNGTQHMDDEITDARDAQNLIHVLRDEVIPLFYDRDADGLPLRWIEMMVESIATLAARFSANRMVIDYVRKCYLVAAGGLSSEMNRR